MSGGSLDYAEYKVTEIAEMVESRASTPLQYAFAKHLRLVATAVHELEWMWSGDTGPGDEEDAIKAVVDKNLVLSCAIERADEARRQLTEAIEIAKQP